MGITPCIIAVPRLAGDSKGDESVTFVYADGRRETETFADIVEMARLYILTDCGGSFERFAEWGLLRPLAQE